MFKRLPFVAYGLGAAGLIPFIACALGAVTTSAWQSSAMMALLGYGAVIMSFLGGVHWGLALTPSGGVEDPPAQRSRLVLGVVPSLIGWAALIVSQALSPDLGIALLIAGLVAIAATEASWAQRDMLPAGYMALRFALSVIVLITLVTVLGLRLIGATIVF